MLKYLFSAVTAFCFGIAQAAAPVPNTFATLPGGNVAASTLDTNFALIANYNTFSNYLVDSGVANVYVVTFPASTTGSLLAGLAIQFKPGADNTGASTLAVNGMTAKNITNFDGSALTAGQIKAGAIVSVIYDGTQFKLNGQFTGGNLGGPVSFPSYVDFTAISNPAAPAAGVARFHALTTQGFTRFEQDNEAPTNLTLARDNVVLVKNTSGSPIAAGKPVYQTGATGSVPNVSLAKADSVTTARTLCIVLDAIGSNAFGQCMKLGIINNVDTSAFAAGNSVYVDAVTAGALTATRPVSPNLVSFIGTVQQANASGSIQVSVAPFIGGQESGTISSSFTSPATFTAFGGASTALTIGNASAAAAFPGGISIPTGKSVTGAGTAAISGFASVSATNLTGTLQTAAQPNITSLGTLAANLLFTDNSYDIGASGATRPRDFYLSRNALVGGTLGVTGVTTLAVTKTQELRSVSGTGTLNQDATFDVPLLTNVGSGILFLREQTTGTWALIPFSIDGATTLLSQSGAQFSITANNASTINAYVTGGVLRIQNKIAGPRVVTYALITNSAG